MTGLDALGWLGQGLYFSRGLVQWVASERAKRIVVPTIYWWFSLVGAASSLVYAIFNKDFVFTLGTAAPVPIYIRNLMLQETRKKLSPVALWGVLLGVGFGAALAFWSGMDDRLREAPTWAAALGIVGLPFWISRFPLQWWLSERAGESRLPPAFFLTSFFGSALLFGYACWTKKPIFIAGQALGPFLYGRGLFVSLRRTGVA